MKPELRFEEVRMRVADLGKSSCLPDLMGEEVLQNRLRFDLDEDDELFEGYGRLKNAYPYRQYDGYTRQWKPRTVKTAVLENKYLKAVFLPEYGGRLWSLTDKEAGRELLYTNDVLQFSNLAVCNAWFSGGVEWNMGVIGHTPFTTAPLYVARTADEDGDPVLRMYEYERIRGAAYQMDFWLTKEGRRLNCRMRITNDTDEVIPMYWWSNIAVPEYDGGRVVVPADSAYTQKEWAVCRTQIPMDGSVDVTDYKTIPLSRDYFFDIGEDEPKYIANLDRGGYGLLQTSTGRLRGRKLFTWGNREASDRWQEFLTDHAGRYLEIQAGLAKTQYGCIPMPPHRAWEWMEQYGAVRMDPALMKDSHEHRRAALTEKLKQERAFEALEDTLASTKKMAKTRARLVSEGSGYGAFAERASCSGHLEFTVQEEELKRWREFLETGILETPPPDKRPGPFFNDEASFCLLKETAENQNRDNWYAHYLLGVRYFEDGSYEKAEGEWKRSLALAENPWAHHGLACTALAAEDRAKSASMILRGMERMRTDRSYLKEGFRMLIRAGAYKELVEFYDGLDRREQESRRLRFFYISACHELGQDQRAFAMLEENGGLELDDIREGEDSIGQLWMEIHERLYGGKGETPHRYQFQAF